MIYVKSKYTNNCYAIWDSSALQYDSWIYITKEEFEESIKKGR